MDRQLGRAGLMSPGTPVIGTGFGRAMPNDTTHITLFVPPPLRGRASGLLTVILFAGSSSCRR